MDALDVVVDAMMMVDVAHEHNDNDHDNDDILIMDPSSSSIQQRRHKRQKQKRTNRPPLCTFVNYLSGPSAPSATTTTTTTTKSSISKSNSRTSVTETTPSTSLSTSVSESNNNDDPLQPSIAPNNAKNDSMQGVVVCPSNDSPEQVLGGSKLVTHNHRTTNTPTKIESMIAARLSLKDDADSITSAETVNTSNKSVDIYLRDSSFDQGPAVERWKKPPPALPAKSKPFWGEDGWYVTSKCESDSESDEEEPAKPIEIIVRTRGRCPRLHSKWQSKGQKLKR